MEGTRTMPKGLHLAIVGLAVLVACGPAEAPPEPPPGPVPAAGNAAGCEEISVHCGATPNAVFDAADRLWVVFAQDGHVHITTSDDLGASYSPAVAVNAEAETIETNGENRPKIALAPNETVYVSWTRKTDGRFTGDIRFSRSTDGGRSFEEVRTVNDDGLVVGHRFDSLHVDAAGDVYLTWIDKRDREAAQQSGTPYRGAAIYTAVSRDDGESFSANRLVAHHACECCRIASADGPGDGKGDGKGDGTAIFWRHVFEPNIRDHAFAVLGAEEILHPMDRATNDGWHLDGCPHHGPAVAPVGDGTRYHLTWLTAADEEPAVYYGRFDPTTGDMENQAWIASSTLAHPHLLAMGERLLLAWKEPADEATLLLVRGSTDGGRSWSEGREVAATAGASDHPFLLGRSGEPYLAWHTATEGFRLLPLSWAGEPPGNPATMK